MMIPINKDRFNDISPSIILILAWKFYVYTKDEMVKSEVDHDLQDIEAKPEEMSSSMIFLFSIK